MFGKPPFGSPAPSTSFGSQGIFGQPSTSSAGLFSSPSTFGQQNKPATFGFGTPQQNTSFLTNQPQATNLFNSSGGSGIFGGSPGFGSGQQSGTVFKFTPVTGNDTMMKGGTQQPISTKHHSITCMKEYEGKSFEELRFEDYQANRKGPQQGATGFGGGTSFGGTPSTNNLFGQTDANKSAFGQTTGFLQTPAFGQNTAQPTAAAFGSSTFGATSSTSSLFGQTDANKQAAFGQATGFGQAPGFGQSTSGGFGMTTAQSNANSPFGKPTAFGATTSSTGFTFGTNSSPFGTSAAQKPFGIGLQSQQSQPSLFGANTTQPSTNFGGGIFNNAQNTGSGLFNKPVQPTPGFGTGQIPGFSLNAPASTQPSLFTNTSKPLFGGTTSSAPAFGSTNTFGTANTGAFGSTFGKPTAPAFGQPQTSGMTSFNSGFGATSTFGTNTTGGFGNSFGKPASTGFGQTQLPTFNSGGLGNASNTGLFINPNQVKPGGLFGGSGTLFNNMPSFQQNSFGLGQASQPPPASLLFVPTLGSISNDPFGQVCFLSGLDSIPKETRDVVTSTDPKGLKAVLDVSRKVDSPRIGKLKVTPLKVARETLFDPAPKNSRDLSDIFYPINTVRKLILRQKDNDTLVSNTNILDILTTENKENQIDSNANIGAKNIDSGKPNPVRLLFDETINDDSMFSYAQANISQTDDSKRDCPGSLSNDEPTVREFVDHKISTRKCQDIVKCTRLEYYTLPSLNELVLDEYGKCLVRGFTVGRKGFGNVYFLDEIDVNGLNLDECIFFQYREINVYPDESTKPPVGEGLNRRAQVTLDNVFPNKSCFTDHSNDKDISKFVKKLKNITEKQNARFIDYRPITGSWVFKVDHFSKYGYIDSDDEKDKNDPHTVKKPEAPISLQQLKPTSNLERGDFARPTDTHGNVKMAIAHSVDMKLVTPGTSEIPNVRHDYSGTFAYHIETELGDEEEEEHDILSDDEESSNVMEIGSETALEKDLPFCKKPSSIQIMKSELFVEDNRSDFSCSNASLTNKYLDLEYLQDFDNIEHIGEMSNMTDSQNTEDQVSEINFDVFRQKTVNKVRPRLWKVMNYRAAETLSVRCFENLHIFKGKAHRVGWDKGFKFFAQNQAKMMCSSELFLKTIQPSQILDPLNDVLPDLLKVVLDESDHIFDTSKIPTFKIREMKSYLQKQNAIFEKLAFQYNSSQAKYLNNIWKLCKALWGQESEDMMTRKYILSRWLETVTADNKTPLFNLNTTTEATSSIFKHLSMHKIQEAAEIALETKHVDLSLLLAQLPLSKKSKTYLLNQCKTWQETSAWHRFPPELKKIYSLLCGISTGDDVNILEGLTWQRAFGIFFWYFTDCAKYPIQKSIDMYRESFQTHTYAQRPIPPYMSSQKTVTDGPLDLMYHVLLLYRLENGRLSSILDPTTHTSDPSDYRLSWLLLQLLISLDIGVISDSELTVFCTSFSNQLEDLGFWEWAVFVLLFMKDNAAKTKLIKSIFERNISIDIGESREETIDLLVNRMKIPAEWIHSVKGEKCLAKKRFFDAFNHFILAENYTKANDVFVIEILNGLFINEQYDYIRNLADRLKPGSEDIKLWQFQTGLILDYLDLLEESILTDNTVTIQMMLHNFCDRIAGSPLKTNYQKVFIAELSKRCFQIYKSLSYLPNSNVKQHTLADYVNSLIMPPDYKHNECFILIYDYCMNFKKQ